MPHQLNKSSVITIFLFCSLICIGGGWLTGLITQEGIKEWYPQLIKPYGTPPNLTFPIVWTLLYMMMALSLTLLMISPSNDKKKTFVFFAVQLGLNFLWSCLFFYMQRPDLALLDIIVLWFFILFTLISLHKHTTTGSYLLIPYLLWVTYAFYLNLFIWIKN